MDILKYLDVMIGLAVVMVLLSPLVTAFTHFVMWLSNGRSTFLLQSLQRLILQLEANPAAIIRVQKDSRPVANARIEPLGVADAQGILWLPNGVADHRQADGLVAVKVTDASGPVAKATLQTTLIPQRIREAQQVVSDRTDAAGKAKIVYTHAGPEGFASSAAALVVRNAASAPIAADVHCTVAGIPLEVTVAPGAAGQFTHPAGPNAPASYEIDCTVTAAGAPQADVVLEARFERNTRFDRTVESQATGQNGEVLLALGVMTEELAVTVGKAVAHHPMVARTPMSGPWSRIPPFRNQEAEVIEREQLIKILLELASGEGAGAAHLTGDGREALARLLAANGIANPSEALARVRAVAQRLEQEEPTLAAHVRHTKAIVEGAKSDFVGKVTHWFDAAMARATQQYAANARFYTMIGAALVAFALQLDSIHLLERLSTDSALRDAFVAEAKIEADRIDRLAAPPTQPEGATSGSESQSSPRSDELQRARDKHKQIEENLAILRKPELSIVPDHFPWQSVPQARFVRNPLLTSSYPSTLELVVGPSSYTLKPRWNQDPLKAIESAIVQSGAPVALEVSEHADDFVVVQSDEPIEIDIVPGTPRESDAKTIANVAAQSATKASVPRAEPVKRSEVAYAGLSLAAAVSRFTDPYDLTKNPLHLVVDDTSVNLVKSDTPPEVKTLTKATFGSTLATLIAAANANLIVTCRDKDHHPATSCTDAAYLVVIARDTAVKDIALLPNAADPYSNILASVDRRPRAWKIPRAVLEAKQSVGLPGSSPDPSPEPRTDTPFFRPRRIPLLASQQSAALPISVRGCASSPQITLNLGERRQQVSLPSCVSPQSTAAAGAADLRFTAAPHRDGELIITSHRRGPLELRSAAGKPETNLLEADLAYVYDWNPAQRDVFGIVLTWALLSLGAPFWFDALKNLLKLRPAPAAAEQQNREERLKDLTRKA